MIRPSEKEEQQLLALTNWIEQANNNKVYPLYVINIIKLEIRVCWENPDFRIKMCSDNLNDTIHELLDKHYLGGFFCETVLSKLEQIKTSILPEVYDDCIESYTKNKVISELFTLERRVKRLDPKFSSEHEMSDKILRCVENQADKVIKNILGLIPNLMILNQELRISNQMNQ